MRLFSPVWRSKVSTTTAWIHAYESALLELDEGRLLDKIAEAKHAILDRAEQLHKTDAPSEREKLRGALQVLDDLRRLSQRDRT
jgi:hypothetical protein